MLEQMADYMFQSIAESYIKLQSILCKKNLSKKEQQELTESFYNQILNMRMNFEELLDRVEKESTGERRERISKLLKETENMISELENYMELLRNEKKYFTDPLRGKNFHFYSLEKMKKLLESKPYGVLCSFEISKHAKENNVLSIVAHFLNAKICRVKDFYIFHTYEKNLNNVIDTLKFLIEEGLILDLKGKEITQHDTLRFPQIILELKSTNRFKDGSR